MKEFLEYINNNTILAYTMKYLINNNSSNFNPYHNFNHNLYVAYQCFNMSNIYVLDDENKNNLIIAGLLHDINHSGGLYKDDKNIEFAIDQLKVISNYLNAYNLSINIYKISKLILATQYPLLDLDLTLDMKIIRDADMLYTFNEGYFQNIILGLAKEFNISLINRLNQQISFIENLKFHTNYANNIWIENKDNLISELKIYNTILL